MKMPDFERWMDRRFSSWHLSGREPCRWCRSKVYRLWHVPGITPDGRMNKVCLSCAARRYAEEFNAAGVRL